MSLSEVDLALCASTRYVITIIGGNAVFLSDRQLGHKLYLGPNSTLSTPAFREYVLSLNHDLDCLTVSSFNAKYNLRS